MSGTGLSNLARLMHWLLTPVWEVGTIVSFILQMRRQTYGEANLPVVARPIKDKSEFKSGHAGFRGSRSVVRGWLKWTAPSELRIPGFGSPKPAVEFQHISYVP